MARKQRSKGSGTLIKRDGRGPWIARWWNHTGERRERSTRTTDRAAAERILAKLINDSALRREGVVDARADRFAEADRRPLSEHVDEWIATLTAAGVTDKQTALLRSRVTSILTATKAQRISELAASAVQTALGNLRDRGVALQTCQHYLRAIKQLSRWLKSDGRARDDALAHISGYNAATDRRHERRALDADELRLLVDTTAAGPVSEALSGADRAMLFQVAAGTGFRASELRSLAPACFRLDDDPPAVALPAASSKRRRDDVQPIRRDLADALRKWLEGRPTDGPLWPGGWHKHGARMIRADLRRAKARWLMATRDRKERRGRRDSEFLAEADGAGRVVDFHALRATYITLLVKSGASVKVVQELARHSDPKLTLNIYSKLGIHDYAGALRGLPSLNSGGPDREPLRAVGTDDGTAMVPNDPHPYPHQLGRETPRTGAAARVDASAAGDSCDARKPLSLAEQREDTRSETERGGFEPPVPLYAVRRFSKPLP
jgi:integrase